MSKFISGTVGRVHQPCVPTSPITITHHAVTDCTFKVDCLDRTGIYESSR